MISSPRSRKGGNMQFYGIDAIEQILSETAFFHQSAYVCIGRTDQAHVDRHRLCASQTADLSFLDGSEQFCLHRQ